MYLLKVNVDQYFFAIQKQDVQNQVPVHCYLTAKHLYNKNQDAFAYNYSNDPAQSGTTSKKGTKHNEVHARIVIQVFLQDRSGV